MNTTTLTTVKFHNHNLLITEREGQPYTPMRPIVEGMGLKWAAQSVKLNRNKRRWGVSIIETVAEDGKNREMLSMPLRKLPAFMCSIHPSKVKEELRETIELFQDECDNALWEYWSKGQSTQPQPTIARLAPEQKGVLHAIVDARCANVPADRQASVRSRMWRVANRVNGVNSYHETPAACFEATKVLLANMDIKTGTVVEPKAIEAPKTVKAIKQEMITVPRQRVENLIAYAKQARKEIDAMNTLHHSICNIGDQLNSLAESSNVCRVKVYTPVHDAMLTVALLESDIGNQLM